MGVLPWQHCPFSDQPVGVFLLKEPPVIDGSIFRKLAVFTAPVEFIGTILDTHTFYLPSAPPKFIGPPLNIQG